MKLVLGFCIALSLMTAHAGMAAEEPLDAPPPRTDITAAELFELDYNAWFLRGENPIDPATGIKTLNLHIVGSEALTGDPSAQTAVFFLYYFGLNKYEAEKYNVPEVKFDVCTAANWLEKAARGRHYPPAMMWMHELYSHGNGVEKDPELAYLWHLAWMHSRNLDWSEPAKSPDEFGITPVQAKKLTDRFESWFSGISIKGYPLLPYSPLSARPPCPGCEAVGFHPCCNEKKENVCETGN